ncbi:hypothetical protein ACFFX0_25530 [Citricoccus parietis]|uniref:Uncharacterized protein n=1 Tax=Citricoccus parietis TaxID=592307 RepID=A0ABV5G602_9MICC
MNSSVGSDWKKSMTRERRSSPANRRPSWAVFDRCSYCCSSGFRSRLLQ